MSGLFWHDEVKPSKQKAKVPEPIWLSPNYLPGLEKARKFDVPLMRDKELVELRGTQMVCDIEIYPNYFLCAFESVVTGKCIYFESNSPKLRWILHNFQIVTFNGNHFDIPILALTLDGKTTEEMKHAADMLIQMEIKPWEMLKAFKVEPLEIDHIDLIEVCPLKASLKIYGGRLHAPKMADLPFPPDSILSKDQIDIIRFYCINDLNTTSLILKNLSEQLAIRKEMSSKYGIDLRSKSDAQVAEAVIKKELRDKTERPKIGAGRAYRYNVPKFLKFKTDVMKDTLERISNALFVVAESGAVTMPQSLEEFTVSLGKSVYKLGIGGLHSTETKVSYKADDNFLLEEFDVASYYPAIILNQGLYPKHLGPNFLNVYRSLVSRRLKAKREGDKITADMLKIVINGSFGKFGSKWSALYSPDLLIQVTITGQLSLLMLIESLELAGISVVSANTDGIVTRYPKVMKDTCVKIISEWQKITNFELEKTDYSAIYIASVNNYIAIYSNETA